MKRKDQVEEIKKASVEELGKKTHEFTEELMKLRFKQASGQHEGGGRRKAIRKQIARVKTELGRRK